MKTYDGEIKKRDAFHARTRSLIALVLVIISFLMLVLPCMKVAVEKSGRSYSLAVLQKRFCIRKGISDAQFERDLFDSINGITDDLMEETGFLINARQAANMAKRLLRGKYSLVDAAVEATYISGLLRELNQAADYFYSDLPSDVRQGLTAFNDALGGSAMAAIILWIVIVALIAAFAAACYSLYSQSKSGVIAYAIVLALAAALVAIGLQGVNRQLEMYSDYVMEALNQLYWTSGIERFGSSSLVLLRLSFAPVVSLVCAAAAVLIMVVRIPADVITTAAKWTCPDCGRKVSIRNDYCPYCGKCRREVLMPEDAGDGKGGKLWPDSNLLKNRGKLYK